MTVRQRRTRGFTLVELLVVITIIGLLVTLTVTGVNMARRAALRATCTNYQSDMAKGIRAFESAKGYFPGYIQTWKAKPVNWVVMVLEFTDHKDVWDRGWRDTGAPTADAASIAALEIKAFKCPADTTNQDPAPLNYVINGTNSTSVRGISRDLSQAASREINKRSSSDIPTASTTILLIERPKTTPTTTGPWASVSGTTANPNIVFTQLTFTWPVSGMATNVLASPHGPGAMVTFCDGRTEFVRDTIDCSLYQPGPL